VAVQGVLQPRFASLIGCFKRRPFPSLACGYKRKAGLIQVKAQYVALYKSVFSERRVDILSTD
jgi:hypothetical protein